MFDMKEKLQELIAPVAIKKGIGYLFGEEKAVTARFSLWADSIYPQLYHYNYNKQYNIDFSNWVLVRFNNRVNSLFATEIIQVVVDIQELINQLETSDKKSLNIQNQSYRNYTSDYRLADGNCVMVYDIRVVALSYAEYLALNNQV